MVRSTNAVYSNRKRKRLFKQAKGFVGDRKNHRRQTSNAVLQAMAYNYVGRKQRKRDFRSLWINRLSVGANLHGISYSKFINGLKKSGCMLNRKMLTEMAIKDPAGFAAVAGHVIKALA
ncbi:MAG: 50S ribosomal protein L20 [Rhabdochlamydiaceae bacterium]|nr:50S ribosomal protein L20 [Rhabdochlamydiaceae bacterium]